jgi:hypothetical protein
MTILASAPRSCDAVTSRSATAPMVNSYFCTRQDTSIAVCFERNNNRFKQNNSAILRIELGFHGKQRVHGGLTTPINEERLG